MKQGFVYIVTNKNKTTLYIGVTNNLMRRIQEHRDGLGSLFTKKYKTHHLVYFETFDSIEEAIKREKQLKRWSRIKKENLINGKNSNWDFLEDNLI